MNVIRTVLIASLGLTTCLTGANARDFFVQAIKAGPVAGTPVASIALQATLSGTTTTTRTTSSSTVGKWLKPYSTTTTTPTTNPATGSTSGSTGGMTTGGSTGGTTGGTTTGSTGSTTGGTTTTTTTPPPPPPTTTTTPPTTTTTTTTSNAPSAPTSTPYPSLGALLSSGQVKAGDRIFLMDGYHGPMTFRGFRFGSTVTVSPMAGATAHVDSILVIDSTNILIRGLKVWPSGAKTTNGALIRNYANSSDITFDQLDVRAEPNAANYLRWTQTEWLNKKIVGALLQGQRTAITNTRMTGIQHGVLAMGASALIEKNIIDGFSGDGMRALGNDSIVRNNRVQNCFQIDGNHADGFQSYSVGSDGRPGTGTVKNVVIENNKFFEWTTTATNPLRCMLQGIGMFDGMYDTFRIENNIVVARGYHGINVAGALNTVIRHNTVVNASGLADKSPWIKVSYHKNGTPPRNVQIVNNFASNITSATDTSKNIYVANNVRAGAATTEFAGFASLNLALKAGSKAIDAGDKTRGTATDITGTARWKGAAPDVGAYENF